MSVSEDPRIQAEACLLPVTRHPCTPMGEESEQSGWQNDSVMRGQDQGQETVSAFHHKPSNSTLNKVYGFGGSPVS